MGKFDEAIADLWEELEEIAELTDRGDEEALEAKVVEMGFERNENGTE